MRKKFLLKFRINPASIKLDIKLFNYWMIWRLLRHPDTITRGITNRCQDKLNYVLFGDFDNIYYEDMKDMLKAVQKKEKLGPIIVMASSEEEKADGEVVGSYHIYELTKRGFDKITPILKQLPVDPNSLRVPRLFSGKAWVLRTEAKVKEKNGEIVKDKPKFKEIIGAKRKPKGKQSFAHYFYLRNHFNIPYLKLNWDKSDKIQKINYTTTSGKWKTFWFKLSL